MKMLNKFFLNLILLLGLMMVSLSAGNTYTKNVKPNYLFFDPNVNKKPHLLELSSKSSTIFRVPTIESTTYKLDSLVARAIPTESDSQISKFELRYDEHNRQIYKGQLSFNWEKNNYIRERKSDYFYFENKLLVKNYTYDSIMSDYDFVETEYDEIGRIKKITTYKDSLLLNNVYEQNDYIYENDRLSKIIQYLNQTTNPNAETIYYYDALGRDTAEVTSSKNYSQEYKITTSYDENGNPQKRVSSSYLNEWIVSEIDSFSFDDYRNCIYYNEDFQPLNDIMNLKYIYRSTYDDDIERSSVCYNDLLDAFPYSFVKQLVKVDLSIGMGADEFQVGSYNFYYSDTNVASVNEHSVNSDKLVFYNSANRTLNIHGSFDKNRLQIYTLNGVMLSEIQISEKNPVGLDLASGVYVFKLISSDRTNYGKLIVK